MSQSTTPDCRTCGACCTDQLILLRRHDRVPVLMQDGLFMRKQDDRCVALVGRVGIDVACSIYKQRPEICRAMKPGVEECLTMRTHRGIL